MCEWDPYVRHLLGGFLKLDLFLKRSGDTWWFGGSGSERFEWASRWGAKDLRIECPNTMLVE